MTIVSLARESTDYLHRLAWGTAGMRMSANAKSWSLWNSWTRGYGNVPPHEFHAQLATYWDTL